LETVASGARDITLSEELSMISGTYPRSIHRTVLFVDDDHDSLSAYAVAVAPEGHSVESASSGAEALAKARSIQPDVIVLDVDLPDIHGLEVLRQLKAGPTTSSIPVILLTALARKLLGSDTALAEGFLSKPCSLDELLDAIVDPTLSRVRRPAEEAASW
jgi:CheY-like chemotaxis protein